MHLVALGPPPEEGGPLIAEGRLTHLDEDHAVSSAEIRDGDGAGIALLLVAPVHGTKVAAEEGQQPLVSGRAVRCGAFGVEHAGQAEGVEVHAAHGGQ